MLQSFNIICWGVPAENKLLYFQAFSSRNFVALRNADSFSPAAFNGFNQNMKKSWAIGLENWPRSSISLILRVTDITRREYGDL